MKFLQKHKKILIIASIIIIAIIIAAIVIIILLNREKETSENTRNLERARELINNNFLYSYLMQGDIVTSDGYVEDEGIIYYYVEDELLSSIQSIEDINMLVQNTFIEGKHELYYENLANGNKYFERNGNLYVAKSTDTCNIMNYKEIEVSIEGISEDKMQIRLPDQIVYAYKENDEWYLGTNNCYCIEEDINVESE